jgi:hypothetical protein
MSSLITYGSLVWQSNLTDIDDARDLFMLVEEGVDPGDFLNHVPSDCWGSKEKVTAWMQARAAARAARSKTIACTSCGKPNLLSPQDVVDGKYACPECLAKEDPSGGDTREAPAQGD